MASTNVIIQGAINGIDLCPSIQSKVDWNKVKAAGFEFVYIQSSKYSNQHEKLYPAYMDSARSAGLLVGAYHFCAHDTDPLLQAQFAFDQAYRVSPDLPIMVDWEHCTPKYYLDRGLEHPKHCVDWLEKFTDELTLLCNMVPIVYTYPNYAQLHQPELSNSTSLGYLPLCYASYSNKSEYVPSSVSEVPFHTPPKPWQKATIVQYSGNNGAFVPGVAGRCDRLVFTGTREEFKCFVGVKTI